MSRAADVEIEFDRLHEFLRTLGSRNEQHPSPQRSPVGHGLCHHWSMEVFTCRTTFATPTPRSDNESPTGYTTVGGLSSNISVIETTSASSKVGEKLYAELPDCHTTEESNDIDASCTEEL